MQPITYKRLLEVIRKKEKFNLVKQPIKEATINEEPDNERSFGLTALTYSIYESIPIDSNFNYYHTELTGIARLDLHIIYGSKDAHDSSHILTRPILENISKIKRNYDISLTRLDGTYIITNGRHRIVYLKNFYEENVVGCLKPDELLELKDLVTIPVKVTKRIEDEEINQIIDKLIKRYPNIFIQKSNYLDELPEIIIIYKKTLCYIRTKEQLIDFYNKIINKEPVDDYKVVISEDETYTYVDIIFEILYERLHEKIYQMDYMDLIYYLKDNPITIEGTLIPIEKINLKYLYAKYVEMVTSYTLCMARNEELPVTTDFASAFFTNQRRIGKTIMDLIYANPSYKDLSWDELYQILHEHPLLKKYDSDYLKDIAIEHGYQIIINRHFFTKNIKK